MKPKPEQPKMSCPKCNAVYDDYDGFGVLYCPSCGYCQHTSVTGEICGFCKKKISITTNTSKVSNKLVDKPKEDWEERFDEEFDYLVDAWNGKKGLSDGMTVKDFIRSVLARQRQEIFSRLPSKQDPMSREEILDKIEQLKGQI